MGRFANSWQIFKTSLGVVKQDKELLWLPILSFLASIVAVAAVVGVGWTAGIFPEVTREDGSVDPAGAALGLLLYLGLAFIQTFFYAAMVAGAHERLSGGDPTVGSALGAAWKKKGKLFLWALVLATVNLILQAIRERLPPAVGQIIAGIAGAAWNLATYFVVPVLMFENAGIGQGMKRSGGLFKKTWGETVVGEMGIGLVAMVLFIPVALVAFLLFVMFSALGTAGFILGLAAAIFVVVLFSVLVTVVQAVYKTELYRFASHGKHDEAFANTPIEHAFRPKDSKPYW